MTQQECEKTKEQLPKKFAWKYFGVEKTKKGRAKGGIITGVRNDWPEIS